MSRTDERRGDKTRFDLLMLAAMTEGQHAPPTMWEQIQSDVRAGLVEKYLEAGDVLSVNVGGNAYDFDVLGIDEDAPVDLTHVLSIQMHKVLRQIVVDPQQYLVAVTAEALASWGISGNELPAGTYNVTLDHGAYNTGTTQDGTYQFTTTQPVPIGGGIRHTQIGVYRSDGQYTKENLLTGTFITYGADTLTVIESGLATAEGNSGINLGTATANDPTYKDGNFVNFTRRQGHGSNRWSTSYLRQLLNSDDAVLSWTPATIFSRNYSTAPEEGFLHSIDPVLRAVLTKVRKRYALSIADGYGYEDVEDYVTLATLLDMGGGYNNSIPEGPVDDGGSVTRTTAYSLWKDSTDADRIKYLEDSPVIWWIGSAYPTVAHGRRYVNATGAFADVGLTNVSRGVVPILYIG